MSKICRTFAPNLEKTMSKMKYIQPNVETLEYQPDAIMLPESPGSTYNPAPKRGGEVIND